MALVHGSRTVGTPIPRIVEVDPTAVRARLVYLTKAAIVGWMAFNAVQWGPQPDAKGNCGCPICDPFSLSAPTPR